MTWVIFLISAVLISLAGIKLAQYADTIAYHTGLGRVFIGALLIAGSTSMPEILTTISAIYQNELNLTAGALFGSCMFNMLLLGILGLIFYRARILRRVALNHALTASLGTLLIGLAVLFILTDLGITVGWLGIDGLVIILVYLAGIWLLRRNPAALPPSEPAPDETTQVPSLSRALIGFAIATAILVISAPLLVRSASTIAEITGLGNSFVGLVLVALVTSLPELTSGISASRVGAYDLAVGSLFGSNMFNMLILGLADLIYIRGSFLATIDPAFAIAGLLAMVLTTLGLVGNLAQVERRVAFVDLDALLLILGYLAGLWLLYTRGIGMG